MRAPMAALRFSSPDFALLAQLTKEDWARALTFCDRAQLTIPLAILCADHLPDEVRAHTTKNLADNTERWHRVQSAYREIASAVEIKDLEFAILKGFSHCPHFVPDPRWRPQYDIDLLLPQDEALKAHAIAIELGYENLGRWSGRVDHLPTLIRKTGWEWRGDIFDPEIPVSLELHFRLWDFATELFEVEGINQFWDRRERREVDGVSFTAFHPVDQAGYASLHLMRHLLRGDSKIFHVYELASLLHRSANDDQFWAQWKEWHSPSLKRIAAICFALAHQWFDCAMHAAVLEGIEALPTEITRWIKMYGFSPLKAEPNKDELWLHWNLVSSNIARRSILLRRLLPVSLPGPVGAVHVPDHDITWRIRLNAKWKYASYTASRASHHLYTLPQVAISATRWFLSNR